MKNKKNKTEYLLREIGEVDDRLLAEAIEYRSRNKERPIYKWGAIAACLALVFIIAVAGPLTRANSEADNEINMDQSSEYLSLDALLLDSVGYYSSVQNTDALSYNGTAALVWQDTESGELYSCYLSQSQLEKLSHAMGKGAEVGVESPAIACKVWVLDGNGGVRSPYLKNNEGNKGCTIFDYEAEILPSEELIRYIAEILT